MDIHPSITDASAGQLDGELLGLRLVEKVAGALIAKHTLTAAEIAALLA